MWLKERLPYFKLHIITHPNICKSYFYPASGKSGRDYKNEFTTVRRSAHISNSKGQRNEL